MSDKRPSEIINAATAELRRKNQERAESRLGQPLTAEELDPDSGYYGVHPTMHDVRRLIAEIERLRAEANAWAVTVTELRSDLEWLRQSFLPEVADVSEQSALLTELGDICQVGGFDDGTLRVCCSTHQMVLCAHHYARTHFVETMPAWHAEHACSRPLRPRPPGAP